MHYLDHIGSLDGSLIAPSLDSTVSVSSRLQAVRTVLQHHSASAPCTKVIFDLKRHYKLLSQVCGICLEGPFEDPKVANWMLDPDAKESPLHRLVKSFIPFELPLLQCKFYTIFPYYMRWLIKRCKNTILFVYQ